MSMRYSGDMGLRQACSQPGSMMSGASSYYSASDGDPKELAMVMQSGGNQSLSSVLQNQHLEHL